MTGTTRPDTINDARLEPGQFLALHIGSGRSNKTVSNDTIRTKDSEFWFFQVADTTDLIEKPIRLYDQAGNPQGPIGANSGSDYSQLFDMNGDDTLRNDERDWTVYHFSVAVQQDNVRIYPRVPENQNGGGFTYLTGDEADPTSPDPFGYIDSTRTDIRNPSTELEALAWRNGQRSVHQYGFFNDNSVQVDPIVSVVGKAYDLRPVTERDAMLNLLADLGKPTDHADNHVHTINFSKSTLRAFSYDVPAGWKDAQNNLEVSRANLPEEIEETLNRSKEASNSSQSGNNRGGVGNGKGGGE